MSRYSRCPHQNASGTATLAPLHQPQLRNPWVAADRAGESQSTNSSSSSRTYRGPGGGGGGGGGGGPGPPPPLWHAPPPPLPADHFNHHPIATHPRAAHYLVDHQLEVLDGPGAAHAATHLLAPPGPGRPPPHAAPPQPYAASSRAASERDRPVTPASSPGGASGSAGGGAGGGGAAAVDGCGGHCVAFENFCYRLLQVIFIAGILTGISLTIAGSVLRHAPSRTLSPSPSSSSNGVGGAEGGVGGGGGRDKAVLVYIGCLVGLVCALLLAVQCCVRRNVKRRKRALRMSMAAAAAGRRGLAHAHAHAHASAGTLPHPHAHAHAHPHAHAAPPGAQQGPVHLAHGGDIPLQELQYQPLLVRLVQQQATASSSSSGNQRLAAASAPGPAPAHAHAPAHYHRPGHAAPAAYREDMEDLDASCSGTPWWRRRGDPRHTRQPHVADTRR